MEGNKDEALRCIERAEEYISKGNKDQAIKFLYKAEKLYTTQKAKGMRYRYAFIVLFSTLMFTMKGFIIK